MAAWAGRCRMTGATATVLCGGQQPRMPSAALVTATSLRSQKRSFTGESEAVLKNAVALPCPAPRPRVLPSHLPSSSKAGLTRKAAQPQPAQK